MALTPPPLLPPRAATELPRQLLDYVATAFALRDPQAQRALLEFFDSGRDALFRGPYVRARMPYAPWTGEAPTCWMPEGFRPYAHQAHAFARLSSAGGRDPRPTLVVTGTGSGKTEAFLYPLLDHARRTLDQRGIKAVILYPMNALASDQADRLARLISGNEELAGVRAGIYIGDTRDGVETSVSEHSLITDREELRLAPPDILLTNYKMLDQLLLRGEDRQMWRDSAASLRYLVLDEFHTYDGAQGSDVALLLRRLGLVLAEALPEDERAAFDTNPLGRIAPVATSATMGSEGDRDSILDFASLVFGTRFDSTSFISEQTLSVDQWRQEIEARLAGAGEGAGSASWGGGQTGAAQAGEADLGEVIVAITDALEGVGAGADGADYARALDAAIRTQVLGVGVDASLSEVIWAMARCDLVGRALKVAAQTTPLLVTEPPAPPREPAILSLGERLVPAALVDELGLERVGAFVSHLCSFLALVRARSLTEAPHLARLLPGIETHLWVRSIRHLDRAVSSQAHFRWSLEGERPSELVEADWLPAIYCRHCGASGWMVALNPGEDTTIERDPHAIRLASVTDRTRTRPLMCSFGEPVEADGPSDMWLNYTQGTLTRLFTDTGVDTVLRVTTYTGTDATEKAKNEVCPVCDGHSGVRYVGAAATTLLSVALSALFGSDEISGDDKRTLVFTDSVQDASYDAAFIRERNRALNLRAKMAAAIRRGRGEMALSSVASALLDVKSGDYLRERFELLPPRHVYNPRFRGFWDQNAGELTRAKRKKVERAALERLGADVVLEFGYRAHLGRSLTSTGAIGVWVDVDDDVLAAVADEALRDAPVHPSFDAAADARRRIQWLRGLLEFVREGGGIAHPYFEEYWASDGNEYLLGNRRTRLKGYPRFTRHQPPEFPRVGPARRDQSNGLVPIASQRGRYARWSAALLDIPLVAASHALADALRLLAETEADGVPLLHTHRPDGVDATIYALQPERVRLRADAGACLECSVCHRRWGMEREVCAQLEGVPCLVQGCRGQLAAHEIPDSYYLRLYGANQARSIVASEHTSLVPAEERHTIEASFKQMVNPPADAPNVLVATPTLEMGIDIGALSTVMLSSVPANVASYVQRVGRAGRLSGNSLVVAIANARPANVYEITHPLSTIAGDVAAPVAYVSAPMILRRQLLACLLDGLDPVTHGYASPSRAEDVLSPGSADRTILDAVMALPTQVLLARCEAFLASLGDHVSPDVAEGLRAWVSGESPVTLHSDIAEARSTYAADVHSLRDRVSLLRERLGELRELGAHVPECADTALRADWRECDRALKAANAQVSARQSEYWISALERYRLLPNFTLVDDTVDLNITMGRLDPSTEEFTTETREYTRSVRTALHELAPGATFYVQSVAATIDAVEFTPGTAVEQWRMCPVCSYMTRDPEQVAEARLCPNCHTGRFSDRGQVRDVLPLTKVSAEVDPTRSAVTNVTDARRVKYFPISCGYSVPDGQVTHPWYLSNGFGVTYYPVIDLHWVNYGSGVGEPFTAGGATHKTAGFHVCAHCGHVDSQAGVNLREDHRPWCKLRNAVEEDTVSFLLGRSMRTEAVIMRLPIAMSSDSLTVPSLRAALMLGFHQTFGGSPEHLEIEEIAIGGGERVRERALLLYDTVIGGTGYLSRFAHPDDVRRLVVTALERVGNCACVLAGSPCCPDCLLPYAGPHREAISNIVAQRALWAILRTVDVVGANSESIAMPSPGALEAVPEWTVLDKAPERPKGSEAEAYFRQLFLEACHEAGWEVREGYDLGRGVVISVPGYPGVWKMSEQVECGRTTPDFLLQYSDPSIPDLAVYIDGREFHQGVRVREDTRLRTGLAREGIWPITLTWSDLDNQRTGKENPWPHPLAQERRAQLAGAMNLAGRDFDLLELPPFQLVLEIMRDPWKRWDYVAFAGLASLDVLMGEPAAEGGRERPLILENEVKHAAEHATLRLSPAGVGDDLAWAKLWRIANHLWPCCWNGSLPQIVVEADWRDGEDVRGGADAGAGGRASVRVGERAATRAEERQRSRAELVGDASGTAGAAGAVPGGDPGAVPGGAADDASAGDPGAVAAGLDAHEAQAWAAARAEFDGEDEIVQAIDALVAAGVKPPLTCDDEVEGVALLLLWNQVALVEERVDEEAARLLATAGWRAFGLDEVEGLAEALKEDR